MGRTLRRKCLAMINWVRIFGSKVHTGCEPLVWPAAMNAAIPAAWGVFPTAPKRDPSPILGARSRQRMVRSLCSRNGEIRPLADVEAMS